MKRATQSASSRRKNLVNEIRLDYTGALAETVGSEHGISKEELAGWHDRSAAALAAVQARRETDLRWLDLPYASDVRASIRSYAESVSGRFENIVVLGIGGSALGPIALESALCGVYHNFHASTDSPRLFVLDNVDPELIGEFLDELEPEKTLFNVISKSGGTAETMSQFLIARAKLIDALGEEAHKEHIVVTTDEKNGVLREIVTREGYQSFIVPDGVGGRFSVLCPVGLVSAALIGIDIDDLCAGAAAMDQRCRSTNFDENPALVYAALQHTMQNAKGKNVAVTFAYSHRLRFLADWYAQLLGESIGKRKGRDGSDVFVGPTPTRAVGVTDQHSQVQLYVEGPFDKWFTLLSVTDPARDVTIPSAYADLEGVAYLGGRTLGELFAAERDGTRIALTEASRPNVTIEFPKVNAHTVGQYLCLMEVAVAVMGEHYAIDAFDQPGVEAGKIAAYALMGRDGYEERRREIESRGAGASRIV